MTKRQLYRLSWIIVILLASTSAIWLAVYALKNNINLYFTPEKIAQARLNQKIRLGGFVKKGSFKRFSGLDLEFIITDHQHDILVKYTGVLPDLFKEGQGVVALGVLRELKDDAPPIFIAEQILAKHDENYTPPLK